MHARPRLVVSAVCERVFFFPSLVSFLTSLVPLFGVQIVTCQPGLEAVSKREVGKLISGSINEILSVQLH